MTLRNTLFTEIGASVAKADATEAQRGRDYLKGRGWAEKAIKVANFRWIDGAEVERLWSGTHDFKPFGALILPFPNDPHYGCARVFYPDDCARIVRPDGKSEDAPKFLLPYGLPAKPYIPPSIRKGFAPEAFIESSFKAALAWSKGVRAIGVNSCHGCHTAEAELPANPTEPQARAWFREELLPYLIPNQSTMFITDADVSTNLQVRKPQLEFLDAAHALGCKPVHRPVPDLGDGKTGIDDYLVDHSVAEWRALPTYARDSRYVEVLRNAFRDRTEIGVADRFIALNGEDTRHDPATDLWYSWNGARWEAGETQAFERMRSTIESLKEEAAAEHGDKEREARLKSAFDFQKHVKIAAALKIAANDPRIRVDSARFDADCHLLGVANGTLDLNGPKPKLIDPAREHLISMCAGTSFNPMARAVLFEAVIARACREDKSLIALIQEIAGAALLGRPLRQEVIFVHGPSNTSKSLFIEIVHDILGDYATATKANLLLRQRGASDPERPTPFLKVLRGKRLVTCSELPENMPVDETVLKDLTGGDMITVRGLHESPISFRNTARILVRCNHLPVVAGTNTSIWNRILIVPFEVVIPDEEQDKDLRAKIIANEAEGVLAWALKGLQRYAARGCRFEVPQAIKEAIELYKRESDVLGTWLDDGWLIDKTETKRQVLQSFVSNDYRDWCITNGHQPMSSKQLWIKLRERLGYDPIVRGTDGYKYAVGFALRALLDLTRNSEVTDLTKAREAKARREKF